MNAPTPSHERLATRDIANHLHSYTNLATHPQVGPLIIERGDGVYVEDDQGRRYIEAMAGLWCTSLGFSHPRLIKAGSDALARLPNYHTFNHRSNPPVIELAERLLALAPVPMSKAFFANSGSEANDTAVKLVWYYHNAIGKRDKKKILSRLGGYHGVTVATASLTGLPYNHKDFDLPIARIGHVDNPHFFKFGRPGETEEQFAARLAESLEARILAEGPDTVAAFIAEPIMGAGGVIVPPAAYFDRIQPVLRKYDVLLIADEVICGFYRTGETFGCATYGIEPDILTCAKALSSGYAPISAVLINDTVHRALADNAGRIGTFGHGFTYSGHPVTTAIALETLKVYEDENIAAHVREIGPRFIERLRGFSDRPLVAEVRGKGLIGGIELMADKAARKPFDPVGKVGARLAALALEQGLIVRAMGDSIGFCPPLIATTAQIDEIFDKFDQALTRLEQTL
ncbi:MAG: aspartate aminotransferase family protein [Burkholderiaceae bacterium]